MFKRCVSLIAQHFNQLQASKSVVRVSSQFMPHLQIVRNKYINHDGIQGNRNSKLKAVSNKNVNTSEDDESSYEELVNLETDAYVILMKQY